MSIQQDYSETLDRQEIFDFLMDKQQTTYDAPPPTRLGYDPSTVAKKQAGPKQDIKLYWGKREYYEVIQDKQVIGHFDLVVPQEQAIEFRVFSVLLTQQGLEAGLKKKIEDAFARYAYPADGDASDFAHDQLGKQIKSDMYAVVSTYSLRMKYGPKPHEDEKTKILEGKDTSVYASPNGKKIPWGDYLETRKIRIVLIGEEDIGRIPKKKRDPLHEVVSNGQTPPGAIKKIADEESKPLNCEGLTLAHYEIADLVTYPEFKIIWRDVPIKIGCITVVLTLPVLQIRYSKLVLDAYAQYPKNIGKYVERIISDCFWFAALSGAVIGVALGNFGAALEAFDALFVECLKRKLGQTIKCMTPGLVLLTEVAQDWKDV